MASGSVFKDSGYTINSARVFDDGAPLSGIEHFYVSTPGKATWVTGLKFYAPSGGAFNSTRIKLHLYIPANDLSVTGTLATNRTDTLDVIVVDGWNEFSLPTPRALPVYSGSGPIQKFSVAVEIGFTNTAYVADNQMSDNVVPSPTISGLTFSEDTSAAGSATPLSRGSFLYGSGTKGLFPFWNGADIQVTDVNPTPAVQPWAKAYVGGTVADKVYVGSAQVWP